MRIARVLVAAAAAAALFVAPSYAQSTGGLRVRVVDEDKLPFPGVAVTLSNTKQLVAQTSVMTDGQGIALFPVLRPGGDYVVTVIAGGYARVSLPNLSVKASQIQDIPIQLSLESATTEVVEVTVKRQVVDLEDPGTTSRYSQEFIRDLPVQGRFYQNVLTLAPGVQDSDGDGNPNVHGTRERDFKASVSGVSNQDPLTGLAMNVINMDTIEEVEVITSGAGVEHRRAQGGFANIIQSQGSNDFEGAFSMLYRSNALDGNGATNLPKSRLPEFEVRRPALVVSGPIIRDKLWYRLAHEYRAEDFPVSTGSAVVTQPLRQTINADQLTWQISQRNKLAFQFQHDPLEIENLGVSSLTPIESTQFRKTGGPTYQLTWSAPYSPKIFVESIVSWQDFELEFGPTRTGVTNDCGFETVTEIGGLADGSCFSLNSGTVSGSFPFNWKDNRQRLTVKSDATFFVGNFLGMTHEFKAGVLVENERYFRRFTRFPQITTGRFDATDAQGNLNTILLVAASLAVRPISEARATGTSWGVYVSDQFKPRSNLSIRLGVAVDREEINAPGVRRFSPEAEYEEWLRRKEGRPQSELAAIVQQVFTAYESIPELENSIRNQMGNQAIAIASAAAQAGFWQNTRRPDQIRVRNTNISPRIAISWDPWNDGKQKFALSAGRFYDKIFLGIPLEETDSPIATANFLFSDSSGTLLPLGGLSVNPNLSFSFVERELKTPYTDEYVLSYERELFTETSLKLSYIRRRGRDWFQDIDVNRRPNDFGRCQVAGPNTPPIIPSPGTGTVIDPFTGQPYEDTDPGPGDGQLDDCAGALVRISGSGGPFGGDALFPRPDGIPDLYALNPAWGSIYLIGNYNSLDYDAFEIVLTRRQYRDWQMDASYVWSEAVGDAEDYNQLLGDDASTLEDERGYVGYDRRHQLKVNATRLLRGGVRLGTSITWQSGLPYSLLLRDFSYTAIAPEIASLGEPDRTIRTRYLTRRRNDQRNRGYWNVDVKATKEFALSRGMTLQLMALVDNLLNDGTYIVYNGQIGYGQQVNGNDDATRRFGRRYEMSMRLQF